MTKLTRQEHDARAMLLGLVYDWRDNTYSKAHVSGPGQPSNGNIVDAETLEPLDGSVWMKRMEEQGTSGCAMEDYDLFPDLPWRVT